MSNSDYEQREGLLRTSPDYSWVVSEIDRNPFDQAVWDKVLTLARDEEGTDQSSRGFYGQVPLSEMIGVAERLRETPSLEDKYLILSERTTTGRLWYDIVLGRVNDKLLEVMGENIGGWRNRAGESSGRRKWVKALDIGTGPGNSLREVQKYSEQAVGLDRLNFLLKVAQAHPDLREKPLVVADALRLPFANEFFDLVVSNGLTFYLPKDQLAKFVSEVSRVLEPGGSYFQAYPTPPKKGEIIHIEKEYLTSGKSVLACLMDRVVTHQYLEEGEEPSEFSLLAKAFEKLGFTCQVTVDRNRGAVVVEFKKKFPRDFEDLKRYYFSGDSQTAFQEAKAIIYGDAAFFQGPWHLIESGNLPPPEQTIRDLYFLRKLGAEQEIIDAESPSKYFLTFISSLVPLVTNDVFAPQVREEGIKTMVGNLRRVVEGKNIQAGETSWHLKGFWRGLRELRQQLENRPGAEEIIAQIDTLIPTP